MQIIAWAKLLNQREFKGKAELHLRVDFFFFAATKDGLPELSSAWTFVGEPANIEVAKFFNMALEHVKQKMIMKHKLLILYIVLPAFLQILIDEGILNCSLSGLVNADFSGHILNSSLKVCIIFGQLMCIL